MNILYNESNEDNKDINNSNKISYFDNKFNKKCLIKGFENLEPIKSGTNYINTISDSLKYFFLNISLNHNVLTEKKDNNEIVYQGSNPDELTLVNCANELDIKFQSCIGNKIKLIFFKQNLEFEILERFEFSSERKRSSIVVEDPISKKIFLYMKGADDVILTEKCLNIFSYEHYFLKTKEHIDNFARAGYRTLCYCMREIDKNEFNNFHNEYKELKTKLISNPNSESLKNEIEKLIGTLEINMVLLGASCLEDKLQNGVKKTISNLIDAGINVWMLTGDKIDTAESIAYSCKLFNDDTNVFRIPKEENEKLLKDKLDEISNAMEEINKNLLKKLNDMRVKKDINENMKFNPNDLKNENEMKNEEKKKEKKLTENIVDINSNKELLNIKRINVTNVNNVKKENNNENKNYNKINSDLESNKDNNINNNNKNEKNII
jgi:magnesium-transporting ATPase (P-type)